MDTLAINNINTLLNIDDDTQFMFNDKKLILDKNSKDIEYGLYFTFHEIFYIVNNTNSNKNTHLRNINDALNNLYDNKQFIDLVDNNENLKNIMDDICEKHEVLTEKYMNKNFCHVIMDELYNRSLLICKSIVRPPYRIEDESDDDDDDDESDDDGFVKDEDLKEC